MTILSESITLAVFTSGAFKCTGCGGEYADYGLLIEHFRTTIDDDHWSIYSPTRAKGA